MSYIADLRSRYPALDSYSDEELIPFLPTIAPNKFGGLQGDDLAYAATTEDSQFTKGLKAGVDQVQALGGGLLALSGDYAGAESVKEKGLDIYQSNMDEAAKYRPESTFTEIDGVGDALDWAGYTLGNLAPTMATAVAGGGIGGIVGKKAAQTAAANLIKSELAKGAGKEAAIKSAGELIAKRIATGQGLGAYVASAGMETGSIYGDTEDANVSALHGAVAGAFDALPVARVLGKFGIAGAAKNEIAGNVVARIAKEGLKQSAFEGGTEGLQTLVEQHAKYWVENNGASLLQNLGDVGWNEVIEATAAGALGGAAMGGPTGLLSRPGENGADRLKDAGKNAVDDAILNQTTSNISQAGNIDEAIDAATKGVNAVTPDTQTAQDLGVSFPENSYLQDQIDVENVKAGTTPDQRHTASMAGIDGLIISARRLGFADEEAKLTTAKRLYSQYKQALDEGNGQLADRYLEQGNKLYRDATGETGLGQPETKQYVDQFPVPYVFQGEVTGGQLTPFGGPNFTMREPDVDSSATTLDVGNRLLEDQGMRIGSEGMIYGTKPPRDFTPVPPNDSGVGQNIVDRMQSNPNRIEAQPGYQGRQISSEQISTVNRTPVTTWSGSQGDGYQTENGAKLARIGRERAQPELQWTVEQRPDGRFEVAGYDVQRETDYTSQIQPIAPQSQQESTPIGSQTTDSISIYASRKREYADADQANDVEKMFAASTSLSDAFDQAVSDTVEQDGIAVLKGKNLTYVVHPSTRTPGKYQVTTYNDTGALGDSTINTPADVSQAIGTNQVEFISGSNAESLLNSLGAAESQYQQEKTGQTLPSDTGGSPAFGITTPEIDGLTTDESAQVAERASTLTPDKFAGWARGRFGNNTDKQRAAMAFVSNNRQDSGDIRGEKIDSEFTAFTPESGTLNIPRSEMPQVKAEHRGALANFLKARGIQGEDKTVAASSLKPTQREFAEAKVQKAKEYEGGDRAILASSDGHILDGHHQWMARRDGGEDVRIIQLDAPIRTLLSEIKEFPSVEQSQESGTVQQSPNTSSETIQSEVKLKSDGRPFPTEKAAKASLPFRKNPGSEVVAVDGGFGVSINNERPQSVDEEQDATVTKQGTIEQPIEKQGAVKQKAGTPEVDQQLSGQDVLFSKSSSGKETVNVPQKSAEWMGFDSLTLNADFEQLASRHPEYYDSAEDVKRDVEYVLSAPENWYPHADGRITVLRSRNGAMPSARIDFRADEDGVYRIASVYVQGKNQAIKKVREKDKIIKSLGLGGQIPDGLSIAAYLDASQPPNPRGKGLPSDKKSVAQDSDSRNLTPTALASEIDKAFGKNFTQALEKSGLFKMVSRDEVPEVIEDVKHSGSGSILGFVKNGVAHLVYDNIGKGDSIKGLVNHEVGVHVMRLGRNSKEFQSILKQVEFMRKGNEKVKAAFRRVPKDTKPENVTEEALSYLIEDNSDISVVKKFLAWFREQIRNLGKTIKGAERFAFIRWANSLNENDLVRMATQATRKAVTPEVAPEATPEVMASKSKPQTETAAFKRWFGKSKVVDKNGEPLVVYHGTRYDFTEFSSDKAIPSQKGIYFTKDPGYAEAYMYGTKGESSRIMPVYLKIENPLIIKDKTKWERIKNKLLGAELKRFERGGSSGVIWEEDLAELKKRGYDGIVNEKEGEIVVFDPTQIKSATGNNGDFDPSNPNILYSRSEGESGFAIPDETLTTVAIRKIQDKFKVLKDLRKNIKEAGGTITEENDAYLAEELFHGKAENDLRLMREQYVEPLAKKMAEFGIERAELDKYLYAKHAPERNKQIAKINPDMPDGGSGMTNRDAADIVAEVRQSGKQEQYDQLAGIVYDMLQVQRDLIREGGLEDDGTLDAWEAAYKHYVPLKGWAEDTKEQGIPGTGKGFNIRGKESQRALGRSTEAASPTAYAITDLTEKLIRKRKNEVGNALLKLIQDNPNPEYWEVFTDENPETDRRIVKVRDEETGEMVEQVRETNIPMAIMKDRYFTTKKDGKTYYMKLADERLMKAMKNIGPETNNGLIRTLAAINRLLSSLNTSYAPEFVISNFARDIQTAVLNLQAEQSAEEGKAYGVKIARKTVKDVPKAMRAIYASLRGKTLNGNAGTWQRHFDEFREAGAKTGWFDMKDLNGQMKDIENLVDMAKGGIKGNALKWMKSSADVVENMNAAVENAVRLSAYVNAREAGLSQQKAASLAKNMTVNFNRRGELGTLLNSLYMFANASTQGVANFARTMGTLKGDKSLRWSNLNNAQKIAVGLVAGSYFLAMINRSGAGDDDDGENFYDKVPDYVKERNLVIMKSLFGGEKGEYWKIPLPYGYNIFHVLGDGMESVFTGNKSAAEAATDFGLATLGSFSPIGFQDSDSVEGLFLKNAAPTVVKPIVDIAMNENFMGSTIYNENFPFGTPKPDSSLARRSTPEAYKKLAEWLNDVSGGSQYRSGAVDINPDVLNYIVDYVGGSAYSFFGTKMPDAITRSMAGIEMEPHKTPFLSRVSGKVLPYEDMDKFYQSRDEIGQIQNELKALSGIERARFQQEYKDKLQLKGMIKSTENQLKLLRKQRDRIYEQDLPLKERDAKLKEIEQRMKKVIDKFNKEYATAA